MRAEVVVCGAGIAGVAVAHHLACQMGVDGVVVCDPRPPLTLTSDKSTECYRNWWPTAPMVALMNRSIDLLEELAAASGNAFGLTRRGYLYLTGDPDRLAALHREAEQTSALDAGELRIHRSRSDDPPYHPSPASGWKDSPTGADLFLTGEGLRREFPWVTPQAVGGLHARRAGWVSAQQLGAWMLERARDAGVRLLPRQITDLEVRRDALRSVTLDDGTRIDTGAVVDAAGPMLAEVGRLAGVDLPVHCEVHNKVAFRDHLGAVPRDAPMTIWADPQRIDWDPDERAGLAADGRGELCEPLPPFCHGRPEGGPESAWVLALWEHRKLVTEPTWPLPTDPLYPELVIRGMATPIPALAAYRDRLPTHRVDGGYYTKTPENLPLIGPAGPRGFVLCGALSGFGVMAAAAAGELAAEWAVGGDLPDHAGAFTLDRYRDPAYRGLLSAAADGQL